MSELMEPSQVIAYLSQENPEALLLEPRELYDRALIGVSTAPEDHWDRESSSCVAVYSTERVLKVLMEMLSCDYQGALDFYLYNTAGSWRGSGTPTFKRESSASLDWSLLDD